MLNGNGMEWETNEYDDLMNVIEVLKLWFVVVTHLNNSFVSS
jgi:hypothetical protein